MNGIVSSNAVGMALMQSGLSPFTLDVDTFQIVWEGENYVVHTDRLPLVFVEKRVPLDLFEYKHENWIVSFAMDRVNMLRTPLAVFRGDVFDTVTFRVCLSPSCEEELHGELAKGLEEINRGIEQFGQACDVAVREDAESELQGLTESLSDPGPDNPWTRGKMRS